MATVLAKAFNENMAFSIFFSILVCLWSDDQYDLVDFAILCFVSIDIRMYCFYVLMQIISYK